MTLIEHKVETEHKLAPTAAGRYQPVYDGVRRRFALLSYFSHDPFTTSTHTLWIIVIILRAFLFKNSTMKTVFCDRRSSRAFCYTNPRLSAFNVPLPFFKDFVSFSDRTMNFISNRCRYSEPNVFYSFRSLLEYFVDPCSWIDWRDMLNCLVKTLWRK